MTTTTQPFSSSSQVCVIVEPCGPSMERYYLYILDPYKMDDSSSSLSIPRRDSIIRFAYDFPPLSAFTVVNSTLYMFGGLMTYRKGLTYRKGWGTASYSYDLSPHRSMDTTTTSDGDTPYLVSFNSKDIKTLPSMSSSKNQPRAVLVDGGKICVFSYWIGAGRLNFELYDLASGTWLPVPEPHIDFSDGTNECAVSFYGVENNWLYICTSKGSFRIDFGRRELQWEEIRPYDPEWYGNRNSFVKDGNMLLFPSFAAYDADNPTKGPQRFRFLEHPKGIFYPSDMRVLGLPKEDKERLRVCIVEAGGFKEGELLTEEDEGIGDVDGDGEAPVLRVSLIKFDDDDDDDDTSGLNPTILNARLFNLDSNIRTFDMSVVGHFLM